MKRILITALLVCVFAVLLCVGAYATDGIYALNATGAAVEPYPATGETAIPAVTKKYGDSNIKLYEDAERLKVTITGAQAEDQYLILLLNADGMPQEASIKYIDQGAGTQVFWVYPSELNASDTYYLKIAKTGGSALETIATFQYLKDAEVSEPDYVLGDVNEDGDVDVSDALVILRSYAGNQELTSVQSLAADVNHDGDVDVTDALIVLQYYAGNRELD